MTSTWEFYGYQGYVPPGVALTAWRLAFNDARQRTDAGHGNQRLGTRIRTWSAAVQNPAVRVDLSLVPREEMTWKMLAEGFNGAAILAVAEQKEFQFIVLAEGVGGEVGYGQTKRRQINEAGDASYISGEGDPGLTLPTDLLAKANTYA